jgi:hypothetical protein
MNSEVTPEEKAALWESEYPRDPYIASLNKLRDGRWENNNGEEDSLCHECREK